MFSSLNFNKQYLYLIPPIILWWTYYKLHKNYKEIEKEQRLFMQKHNCVVMYLNGKGMSGWPSYPGRLALTLDNRFKFMEPITYFLDTAEKTLDIAVMSITLDPIISSIKEALNRGVAIRIMSDGRFYNKQIKDFEKLGAEVLYSYPNHNIMHYKYVVKDYSEQKGFCLFGSLNWTQGVVDNSENLVFTSDFKVVSSLYKNFNETWVEITQDKMNHMFND